MTWAQIVQTSQKIVQTGPPVKFENVPVGRDRQMTRTYSIKSIAGTFDREIAHFGAEILFFFR
jgi:hypothetical protein